MMASSYDSLEFTDVDNDSISETHLKLLQSLVKENKLLRDEQVKQGNALKDIDSKIASLANIGSENNIQKRRRSSKTHVPRDCSVSMENIHIFSDIKPCVVLSSVYSKSKELLSMMLKTSEILL